AACHVLQHLAMHGVERWALFFESGDAVYLLVAAKTGIGLFPRQLSFFEQAIVQPAALVKGCLHSCFLCRRRIESILERLAHTSVIPCTGPRLKPLKRVQGFYPKAEAPEFYAPIHNKKARPIQGTGQGPRYHPR